MRGMRRLDKVSTVAIKDQARLKIEDDVERFLASGGKIKKYSHGDTELINGLPANLISKNHLGSLRRAG